MRQTVLSAALAIILCGAAPAFAGPPTCAGPDTDGDLISDCADNCSDLSNSQQVDVDADLCGNVCDTDWNQLGLVDFADFGLWSLAFGGTDPNFKVLQPHTGSVSFADFGQWSLAFGSAPGPSGTTTGSTACP